MSKKRSAEYWKLIVWLKDCQDENVVRRGRLEGSMSEKRQQWSKGYLDGIDNTLQDVLDYLRGNEK